MNDEILERLEKLEDAKEEFLQEPQLWNHVTYLNRLEALIDALDSHKLLNEGRTRFTAIDYFADFHHHSIHQKRSFNSPFLKSIFELLNPRGNLEYLTKKLNNEGVLIDYFMNYSVLCAKKYDIGYTRAFREQITRWTGVLDESEERPDLEYVVTQLFGKTCWGLYGMILDGTEDSTDVAETIDNIVTANLPLVFKHQETTKELNLNLNIPDTLV